MNNTELIEFFLQQLSQEKQKLPGTVGLERDETRQKIKAYKSTIKLIDSKIQSFFLPLKKRRNEGNYGL